MKKLIALLLVIAMVGCLFAACASDGNNDTQPATDAPTESNDNNSDNTDNTDNTDNNESGKTYKIIDLQDHLCHSVYGFRFLEPDRDRHQAGHEGLRSAARR